MTGTTLALQLSSEMLSINQTVGFQEETQENIDHNVGCLYVIHKSIRLDLESMSMPKLP